MKFINWFRGRMSARFRAMARYRQGMKSAQRHDHQQALAAYSQVIEMADAPGDVTAMALYNRALVYAAMENQAAAIADLSRVLTMGGTSEQVRTEARRKLTRMDRSQARSASDQ